MGEVTQSLTCIMDSQLWTEETGREEVSFTDILSSPIPGPPAPQVYKKTPSVIPALNSFL